MGFYKDRDYIKNEYQNAHWDKSTGIEPEEIERKMKEFIADKNTPPKAIQRAKLLEMLIQNAQLELNPHTPFPDKINNGVRYGKVASFGVFGKICFNEYYQDFDKLAPEVRGERKLLERTGSGIPDVDFWHVVPDWEAVLTLGFKGLEDRVAAAKEKTIAEGLFTAERGIFYESVEISLRALRLYVNRCAEYARKKGMNEYADNMEYINGHPPKTLWQAMQTARVFLTVGELGFERIRTLGAIDRLYYPYYRYDLSHGKSNEDVKELFRYFFEKISAEKRSADQPLCIGGKNEKGEWYVNDLTYIILDVYDELGNHNPKIHVRAAEDMPDRLLTKVTDMIRRGHSSLVLLNDDVAFRAYEKLGVSRSVSAEYCPLGCYECVIPGVEDARICASWLNIAKAVELAVFCGRGSMHPNKVLTFESAEEPVCYEQFYSVFLQHLRALAEKICDNIVRQTKYQYIVNPFPLMSSTVRSCVENGRDIFNDGMQIRNTSVKCMALATAVDSLMAIKKFVYEDKEITLSELRSILASDWEGREELRGRVMRFEKKWGNNIGEVNDTGREIMKFLAHLILNRPNGNGGVFRMGTDSVNFSEVYGKNVGATPDGRKKSEPLSKNMRPVNGMERKGVTAFIQSITALDNSDFIDGAPCDFILHPTAVEGEKGLQAFKSLFRVFFKAGGFVVQGNVTDAKTLIDAKAHPEKYPELQVRVCGWNEYFVEMSEVVQDDFINRALGVEQA